MDNALSELLKAVGAKQFEIDFQGEQLYQLYVLYLIDQSRVPPDIRQIFDAMTRRDWIPKPKDDEAFRFFSDDES